MPSSSDGEESPRDRVPLGAENAFLAYERVAAELRERKLRMSNPETGSEELARLEAELQRSFRAYAADTNDFNILESGTRVFQEYVQISTDLVHNITRSVHHAKDLQYCTNRLADFGSGNTLGSLQQLLQKCGRQLAKYASVAPPFDNLQFVPAAEHKVVTRRQRATRNTDAAQTATRIELQDINREDKMNQLASQVLAVVKEAYQERQRPIPFAEVMFNKYSYGQTFENMFLLSILAANGKIKTFVSDGGFLAVEPPGDVRGGHKRARQQVVTELSLSHWNRLREIYTGEPLVPNREYGGGGLESDEQEPTQQDDFLIADADEPGEYVNGTDGHANTAYALNGTLNGTLNGVSNGVINGTDRSDSETSGYTPETEALGRGIRRPRSSDSDQGPPSRRRRNNDFVAPIL